MTSPLVFLPLDEMNRCCSVKYGWPFDVRKLVISSMPEPYAAFVLRGELLYKYITLIPPSMGD